MLPAGLSRVVLASYWAVRAIFVGFFFFFPPEGWEPSLAGGQSRAGSRLGSLPASPRGQSRRLLAHPPGSRFSSGKSKSISSR